MSANNRLSQIDNEIQRELASLLRGMKDPRLQQGLISVSHVETSRDLSVCKVFISSLEDGGGEIAALKGAAGYLRTALASALSLRHVPKLTFIRDRSIAEGAHILTLIEQAGKGDSSDENGD